jgi:hydroxymethylbilane synthase
MMRLGSRGSQLALAQATACAALLRQGNPGLEVELIILKTSGDQKADIPLSSAGGMGLFTKELEDALLRGEIDAAVHSLKDLPTRLSPGLALGAVSTREDWRDAWISATDFKALPQGALVGTGSPRRRAQLARLRPDLRFSEFRGNVDTRLRKLSEGQVAGAVLAAAGLKRLGRLADARSLFGEEEMLPAPGQGFLGLEARMGDEKSMQSLRVLMDMQARACAKAERGFLDRLGAGCHAPVAALARLEGSTVRLKGFTQNRDGKVFEGSLESPLAQAEGLGASLAERLISQGAELTR